VWFPRAWRYDEIDNEGKLVNGSTPAQGIATTRDGWKKWKIGVAQRA